MSHCESVIFANFMNSLNSVYAGGFNHDNPGFALDSEAYPQLPVDSFNDKWNVLWIGRFKKDTFKMYVLFPVGTVVVAGEVIR
jgi:hypothetical protein